MIGCARSGNLLRTWTVGSEGGHIGINSPKNQVGSKSPDKTRQEAESLADDEWFAKLAETDP